MKYFFTAGLLFISFFLSGQSGTLDSLIVELKKIEQDSAMVDALIDHAWTYRRVVPEVSLGLLQYLEEFEQENNFKYREDVKWYYYSLLYKDQSNFEKSEDNLLKYINYNAQKKDTVRMVFGHYSLSNLYFDFKFLDKSMEAAFKVLDLKEGQKDTTLLVNMTRRIGAILTELNQYDEAMKFHNQAKALSLAARDYYLLADVYNDIGIIYEQTGPKDSMLFYYQQYLDLSTQYGSEHQQLYANYNLGAAYSDFDEYQKAHDYFEKSMILAQKTSSGLMFDFSKISLAHMKTKLGDFDGSLSILKTLDAATKSTNVQQELYQQLYEVHYAKGQYKEAVDYHQKFKIISDTLLNRDIAKQINELNIQYESEKKNQEIKAQQLELRNSRLLLFTLGALLGAIVLGFLFWNRNQRYKANLLKEKTRSQELEIEGLHKEKQLISMQSILTGQEEERRRIARDLHDNIGSMMAAIKFKIYSIKDDNEQLDDMVGQVSDELRRISHNMTPLAFGLSGLEGAISDLGQELKRNNIQVSNNTRDLEQIEDQDRAIMIYRVFQELVNNIIKHSEATQVQMSSSIEGPSLNMDIRDNGKGLDHQKWENSTNLGIKNIKSRIDYLGGEITLDNSKGTHFNLKIPL